MIGADDRGPTAYFRLQRAPDRAPVQYERRRLEQTILYCQVMQ